MLSTVLYYELAMKVPIPVGITVYLLTWGLGHLRCLVLSSFAELRSTFLAHSQARIQVFLGGARNPPPPTAVCNIFFIFKPTDVNFPLPFKFHCRIQST